MPASRSATELNSFLNTIFRDTRLSRAQALTAVRLTFLSRKLGYTYASKAYLAKLVNVNVRSIPRITAELARLGYFTAKPGVGRSRATQYTPCLGITTPESSEVQEPKRRPTRIRDTIIDHDTGAIVDDDEEAMDDSYAGVFGR